MILTTTPSVEGRTIAEYKGIVFGEVISGVNFFKDFKASIRNVIGGRSSSYEGELIRAREQVLQEILGGHFGEGIDLVGDKLSGVIIVGVGIPQISPEREILSNYFSDKFGDGYAFAYRFPGWEKVLQAVGRVIRTEEDTGFALLIDDRLEKPEYLQLYPDHWQI